MKYFCDILYPILDHLDYTGVLIFISSPSNPMSIEQQSHIEHTERHGLSPEALEARSEALDRAADRAREMRNQSDRETRAETVRAEEQLISDLDFAFGPS